MDAPGGSSMGAGAVARVEPLARAVAGKSIRPSLLRSHLVAVSAGVGRSASVDCNAATQRNGPLAATPIGLESVAAARQDSSSSSARSHVGPVMGIFFKVWSLVKVTKGRHHSQRLRRQQSEDAAQFQYISGDRFAAAAAAPTAAAAGTPPLTPAGASPYPLEQAPQPQPLSLRRSSPSVHLYEPHFRRAGSQPARASPPLAGSDQRLGAGRASAAAVATPISGTNSSSSGVSSTTSTTTTNAAAAASQLAASAERQRRRLAAADGRDKHPPGCTEAGLGRPASWATRIKRSATSVNHREMRLRSTKRPSNFDAADGSSTNHRQSVPAPREARAQSEALGGVGGGGERSTRQTYGRQRVAPERSSLDYEDEEDEADSVVGAGSESEADADADESIGARKLWRRRKRPEMDTRRDGDDDAAEGENSNDDDDGEDEEEDANDIYSTPNDSVQSVKSSVLQQQQQSTQPTQPLRQTQLQRRRPSNPIMKSFSTNNFDHLVKQQQQQTRFAPIDEPPAARRLDLADQAAATAAAAAASKAGERRANCAAGSRFFISSSSSSDDSNAAHNQLQQQQQQQQQQVGQRATAQVNEPPQHIGPLEQRRAHYPVQLALHYHEPGGWAAAPRATRRPVSLQLAQQQQQQRQQQPAVGHACPQAVGAPVAQTPTAPKLHWLHGPSSNQPIASVSPAPPGRHLYLGAGYTKSPSLFEMSSAAAAPPLPARPFQGSAAGQQPQAQVGSATARTSTPLGANQTMGCNVPNSISLHDCKQVHVAQRLASTANNNNRLVGHNSAHLGAARGGARDDDDDFSDVAAKRNDDEYKLAQMLLELGANPSAKDRDGNTALMHAIMSENLPATKCLIEHGVDLNDTNDADLSALDLVCSRRPIDSRLETLKMLIDNGADFDRARKSDGSRLLDRLISEHSSVFAGSDKLKFIDCLLQSGAKLGSSTWLAANGKRDVQLRLLKKLCQDGYFLYKKCSIEAAVFRFEYALKRITELELQLSRDLHRSFAAAAAAAQVCCKPQAHQIQSNSNNFYHLINPNDCHNYNNYNNNKDEANCNGINRNTDQITLQATQQLKYQTYLGLSRCERKRKFYKRALEFAHMSILVDSTSYEGYYSKAHILKDLGELDDALFSIDQTSRLVDSSMQSIRLGLDELAHQEEALVFDNCFDVQNARNSSSLLEATKLELVNNFDYLQEAKRHIARLRSEIIQDKCARDKSPDESLVRETQQQRPTNASPPSSIIKQSA